MAFMFQICDYSSCKIMSRQMLVLVLAQTQWSRCCLMRVTGKSPITINDNDPGGFYDLLLLITKPWCLQPRGCSLFAVRCLLFAVRLWSILLLSSYALTLCVRCSNSPSTVSSSDFLLSIIIRLISIQSSSRFVTTSSSLTCCITLAKWLVLYLVALLLETSRRRYPW